MSFDLGVWHSPRALTRKEADRIYRALCEDGLPEDLTPSPAVAAFARDLEKKSPEEAMEDWPPTPLYDTYLILHLAWSSAEKLAPVILRLAAKHGLICYDPQEEKVHHPPKLRSSVPVDDEPRPRELFQECCREIGGGLSDAGFTYGWDFGPHVDRRRGPVDEVVGFTWYPTDGGAEFRMTLAIQCKDLIPWREEQKKRDARLPLGSQDAVASLDFRQLKPAHELFGWDLKTPADWKRVAKEAVVLILTQGSQYSALFESPVTLVDRFRQADVPGLRIADVLEFSLALGSRTLAADLLDGFLARRSDLQIPFEEAFRSVRAGGGPPVQCPPDAWNCARAAHCYGLR